MKSEKLENIGLSVAITVYKNLEMIGETLMSENGTCGDKTGFEVEAGFQYGHSCISASSISHVSK